MTRVASLGMYDLPELHAANDRLWSAIADRLRAHGMQDVPSGLDRSRPLAAIWDDPALILAQTCGYPLTTAWRDRLTYVATPLYDVRGCSGPNHRSRFVVRRESGIVSLAACKGRRVAVNDPASNSGMNLLRVAIAPLSSDGAFFGDVVMTGSHAASAAAVADGTADVAAIDAVTFAHLEQAMPDATEALLTIGWSSAAPSLPFVTSVNTPPATLRWLRRALREAIAAVPSAAAALRLDGIACIGLRRYDAIIDFEKRAIDAGYGHLR